MLNQTSRPLWPSFLRFFVVPVLLLLTAAAPPTQPLAEAPKTASYRISARLDPQAKTVSGTETISYTNPSQDTLREVYLRLYLKAFSSLDTLWVKEGGGQLRGDKLDPSRLGDITVERLTLGGADLLSSATLSDTLLRVPLPQPLPPGGALTLDVAWTSKLPRVFARTGYGGKNDTFFMVGQWYPKLAVYDRGRWDTEPWHANSEFFNDFGDYDVTLDVPQGYVVAGAGVPVGEPQLANGRSVSVYRSTSVTDYAFAASPDFQRHSAQAGPVTVALYVMPEHAGSVQEYLDTAVGTVSTLSAWFGQYPHPRLTVVDVPDDANGAGGMEYPTLITGGTQGLPAGSGAVALVTAHEIGHQWWPMQTATNEGREPWLDEGLTEYSGNRFLDEAGIKVGFAGQLAVSSVMVDRLFYAGAPAGVALDQPAWRYSGGDYGALVYGKTALGVWTLEKTVGSARFRAAMAAYLREWRFRHPTAADFRAVLERELGPQPWFFEDYVKGGTIGYAVSNISQTSEGDQVTLTRTGDVPVPVEVRVTRVSGRAETQVWDGQTAEYRFTVDTSEPLASVEIDPERKLVAELDIKDNGRSLRPEVGPAAGVGARLLLLFQALAQLFGLFG